MEWKRRKHTQEPPEAPPATPATGARATSAPTAIDLRALRAIRETAAERRRAESAPGAPAADTTAAPVTTGPTGTKPIGAEPTGPRAAQAVAPDQGGLPIWGGSTRTLPRRHSQTTPVPAPAVPEAIPEECPNCHGRVRVDMVDLVAGITHLSCPDCGLIFTAKAIAG